MNLLSENQGKSRERQSSRGKKDGDGNKRKLTRLCAALALLGDWGHRGKKPIIRAYWGNSR